MHTKLLKQKEKKKTEIQVGIYKLWIKCESFVELSKK